MHIACSVPLCITDYHEGATEALWVLGVVRVVADVHIKVLQKLVGVCVLIGLVSCVQILDYSNAVLKDNFFEVDGDFHDVTEWTELNMSCLVTRLIGCGGSSLVDKRPEVVATSSAASICYEVSGTVLSGL